MTARSYPLSSEEFERIYSRVPRLTVEIVLRNKKGEVYLTKRAIEPCKGQWHLPGGTVLFGESLQQAVQRIGEREIGIRILETKDKGYIEYPSHYLNGMDEPVGIVFEAIKYTGKLNLNNEAEGGNWFAKLPANMHADQDNFLIEAGYLK